MGFIGKLQEGDIATAQAAGMPTSWDNIDRDELVDEYADMLANRGVEQVLQKR